MKTLNIASNASLEVLAEDELTLVVGGCHRRGYGRGYGRGHGGGRRGHGYYPERREDSDGDDSSEPSVNVNNQEVNISITVTQDNF